MSWNKHSFQNVDKVISLLECEIDSLNKDLEDENINEIIRKEMFRKKKVLLYNLWEKLKNRGSIRKQKSRVKWCGIGDRITRFFHLAASIRSLGNKNFTIEH